MQVIGVEGEQVCMRLSPQSWMRADDDVQDICTSVLYSLADSASGLAVFAAVRELKPIATLDLRMDYLRSTAGHPALLATAYCHHLSEEVAFVRCEIHAEGEQQPVAVSNATFMRGTQNKRFQAAIERAGGA
ncbi:Thioesterase superfamily protein [Salinisphaera shabanensis E1L3A]|uniref:Thioesterase superfamily protein n=2 Tax=Salinisphaera shabanensis TaxID=180542 RepID=U2EH71_9GAMM|nr:Thioesterase superfamily protein [Salinisphaera shabanensis E1L3A]